MKGPSPGGHLRRLAGLGEVRAKVRLRAWPGGERCEEVELTVDTGSTYSWIPGPVLQRLGVRPVRRARFRTIEGRVIERWVGHALMEYGGEEAPTVVVFAEEGDACVLGLHALEALGLEVDPMTGELRKSEALMAYAV